MDVPGDFGGGDAWTGGADVTDPYDTAVKRATVWRCGSVGTREYSEDEVLAMMRVENPGWFGDEKAGDE